MTKAKWYVRHRFNTACNTASETVGQTVGPLDLAEIADLLRIHQLTWLDFAHSGESGAEWKLLWGIPELRADVSDERLASNGQGWVLQRGEEPVSGPFKLESLRAMLASGEINFSDRVWAEGFTKWFKTSERAEFDRGRYHSSFDASSLEDEPALASSEIPDEPELFVSENFLRDVVRRDTRAPISTPARSDVKSFDQRPSEASGDDLLNTPSWMKPLLIALFVIAAGRAGAATTPATNPVMPPVTSMATTLKMSGVGLSGAEPALSFQTDAVPGEVISIHLRARSGEILKLPSFDQTLSIQRKGGETPVVSLKNLDLPPGTYEVEASVGTVEVAQSIFIGVKDVAFESELGQHKKQISSEQQAEKKALFYGAKQLLRLSRSLYARINKDNLADASAKGGWTGFYENWKKQVATASAVMDALKSEVTAAGGLMFPEQMANYQEAAEQLIETAQRVDGVGLKDQRGVASVNRDFKLDAEASESKFKVMMDKAAALSVYDTK